MFASGSMVRRASLVAATVALVGVTAAQPARALEGIQGRHAIFYPSLELIYQHDDNFFLNKTGHVSAESFIAHAHFRLEVPGARQYLELEYEPQYRDVNVDQGGYTVPDDLQHFWMLHAKLRGSSLFSVDIHHNYRLLNLETDSLDSNRELVRSDARFWVHSLGVDFKWEGSRQGATLSGNYKGTGFGHNNNSPAPVWFTLNQIGFGAQYFYKFTPLTRFMIGWDISNAKQDYTQAWRALQQSGSTFIDNLKSVQNDVYVGFSGELGRTTTGNARLGFANLNYDAPAAYDTVTDLDVLTLNADVTKSFSRYSKLIFEVDRGPNFSGLVTKDVAGNNARLDTYYIDNRASISFTNQPQGARVGWTIAGSFQRNDYDQPVFHSAQNPVSGLYDRQDDIKMLRAEVGYHPLEHLSFRINYRWENRDSNDLAWEYTDNIVAFQVQFGF